jgi:hypothetical protein
MMRRGVDLHLMGEVAAIRQTEGEMITRVLSM